MPGAQDYKGDYLGFYFNEKHSSEFNIVRVSTSNRYQETLFPTIKDIAVDKPGNDGQYYYGSQYTKKEIKVDFAFDSMTAEQYYGFASWIGDKKIHKLYFDEDIVNPETANEKIWYYMAKVTSSAALKYVCFDENGQDIYKGEGSLTFICYWPYLICEHTISSTISVRINDTGELPSPFRITLNNITNQTYNFMKNGVKFLCFNSKDQTLELDGTLELDTRRGTLYFTDKQNRLFDASKYIDYNTICDLFSEVQQNDRIKVQSNGKDCAITVQYYSFKR